MVGLLLNNELEKSERKLLWSFEVLSRHLLGGAEENLVIPSRDGRRADRNSEQTLALG
jgi:hypothetical protein